MKASGNLTTQGYWRSFWQRKRATTYAPGLPWYRDWFRFQKQHLPQGKDLCLLEVGCAASRWLPIYAEDFGYRVFGIDYDEEGCRMARSILAARSQPGEIVCADFLDFAVRSRSQFDIVVSFGFVEHFKGSEVVDAMFTCLKPGGFVFATVPNLQGLQGLAFELIEDWKQTHVVHTPRSLRELLESSGFVEVVVEYAGGLGVPVPRPRGWRRILLPFHAMMWTWLLLVYGCSRMFGWSMHTRHTASSIMLVGRKPAICQVDSRGTEHSEEVESSFQ
jgi:SAM-dependent methyltransferase